MNDIIRGSWIGEKESIRWMVIDKINKVDTLQEEIRNQPDHKIRELLVIKCRDEQKN